MHLPPIAAYLRDLQEFFKRTFIIFSKHLNFWQKNKYLQYFEYWSFVLSFAPQPKSIHNLSLYIKTREIFDWNLFMLFLFRAVITIYWNWFFLNGFPSYFSRGHTKHETSMTHFFWQTFPMCIKLCGLVSVFIVIKYRLRLNPS